MLVASVMSLRLVTTQPDRPAAAAARVMRAHRFRHLPVLDHGRLVGMLSDRDVNEASEASVADVMRRDVISVTPDTPVETAATLLVENKIGALPVISEDSAALVGIVTQTDLLDVLARLLGGAGPSTRLELLLDDVPRQLSRATALACQLGIPISSMVTVPASIDGPPGYEVVMRVGTMVAARFVAALREAGITVDAPQLAGNG